MSEYSNTYTVGDATELHIFEEVKPLPVYYSENAVYAFSILCGAFFGSILMALNLKQHDGRRGVWQVLSFGVLFTILQIVVQDFFLANSSGLSIFFALISGQVMKFYFWRKYIGRGVLYVRKSVVIPTIIAIVLYSIIIAIIAVIFIPA